jgi:hypothetical protein
MLHAAWSALELPEGALGAVHFGGAGDLPSYFATTDLAAASVAAAGLAMRELIEALGGDAAQVAVDRRLASLWFGWSIHPVGWERPPLWDAVAGDYATADGWIRLHTNASHHRDAALAVLACPADRDAVARAVAAWGGAALEEAVVRQGGCAAAMRSMAAWAEHPQGRAVAAEPLIAMGAMPASASRSWAGTPTRPLTGLKVLDLTRVLAGPVATRFLAGYGADVLRLDPPGWNEPGVIPEVALGKRCARLDLTLPAHRAIFERLLAEADVLVHGYRPAALEHLGYGEQFRRRLNPELIDVSLDAYGWDRAAGWPPRLRQPGADELRHRGAWHAGARRGQAGTAAGTGARSCDRLPDGRRHRARPAVSPDRRARDAGPPVAGAHGQVVDRCVVQRRRQGGWRGGVLGPCASHGSGNRGRSGAATGADGMGAGASLPSAAGHRRRANGMGPAGGQPWLVRPGLGRRARRGLSRELRRKSGENEEKMRRESRRKDALGAD